MFMLTAPATGAAGDEGEAYRSAALASYKQSGLETMVDSYVQRQLKHVPQTVQDVAANTFLVAKTIQERKITYKWSF